MRVTNFDLQGKLLASYLLVVVVGLGVFYWWMEVWKALLLLVAGATVVFLISSRFTRSIDRLSQAARQIAAGDFVDSIPVRSSDELGRLARNMEQMSTVLRTQLQRLESERNFVGTVLGSMAEAVLVTDRKGRIAEVNPAFQSIFALESDPLGKWPLEVIRSEEIQEGIQRVLRESRFHQEEIRTGEKRLIAQFAPIRSEGGLLGVVTVFHDVTQLRRLEGLRKEFVSSVSHELRTPLTSIQGYAETLLAEEMDSVQREFVQKILRHARQLSEMIGELFTLARLESGEERLVLQPLSFAVLMQEMEREFAPRLAEKEIRFTARNLHENDEFLAGRGYLRRIFHNLMDNALKYTSGGEIEVTLRREQGELVFSLRDSGIGIPKSDLERIFERFYRVQRNRSRDAGGSGIGLAIVKHLVQLHGGHVWAESEMGKGTTVHFTLSDPTA